MILYCLQFERPSDLDDRDKNFALIIKKKARRDSRAVDIERFGGQRTKIRRFVNSVCEAFGIGA